MEKIPAACAMAWSIDLEKGLRSKSRDQRIRAIEQMGPILQKWSTEPNVTRAIADMYDLEPGEDRLFANTILLRLADAFRCGDNYTRRCIVKVFLFELTRISKEGKRYNGILAKRRVPNSIELLKRVKVVYDTGDTEAKTLALRLFGCWADLAKDSAHIRYIILLSLQSSNISEVKASLFATGCFCLLSEDFVHITLEILINIVRSTQLSYDVAIAAIHAISRMRCSSAVASRAYKAGKKLLLGPLHDDLKAEMLSSLSKLAFRSTILTIEQAELLLSFLSNDTIYNVKARALKCLHFLFSSHACCFPFIEGVVVKLFHIVDDNDVPVNLQCEALRILCKVFSSMLPDVLHMDLLVLVKQVLVMEEQSLKVKRDLVIQLIVHILCSLKMAERGHNCATPVKWCGRCFELQRSPRAEVSATETDASGIACQVTSIVIGHITSMIKQTIADSTGEDITTKTVISCSELKQEFRNKLSLIQLLVIEYPSASLVVLDRIGDIIQSLENMHDKSALESICTEVSRKEFNVKRCGPLEYDKQYSIGSEIAICILRFTNAFIKTLNNSGTYNSEVCQKVKLLVKCIQSSKYCNCATYEIFCLCLDSYTACSLVGNANNRIQDSDESKTGSADGSYYNFSWVNQEWQSLESIRSMLQNQNYWAAYRAGKYSCLEGLWFSATFTFRKLICHVESVCLSCWLKCLMLLAGCETEIKLLLFPKAGITLVNGMQTENMCDKIFTSIVGDKSTSADLHGWEGKIARVYGRICSAEKTLASAGASDGVYYFQRWFLNLRAKFFEIMMEIFGLLNSHELTIVRVDGEEGKGKVCIEEVTQSMSTLMCGFAYESLRLNNLAKDYDLLASSFLDTDGQSFRRLSAMALNCSLLAFCTAFTVHFPCSLVYKNVISCNLGNVSKFSCTMILQDLTERFWTMDSKISEQLQQILTSFCKEEDRICPRSRMSTSGHTERATLLVCEFAISGILHIQEDAKRVKNEEDLFSLLLRGLQLLSDVIRRWMEIPFQVPKYFFRVRPCIGAELFLLDADSRNKSEISVSQGFQLSLNVCIQLKNTSRIPRLQDAKLYCILATRPSEQLSTEKRTEDCFSACKTDEMVELNNMLLMFVKAKMGNANEVSPKDSGGDAWVTACLCFEPNKQGQGFSSCLLDVSEFPDGSYQIKWHSCCIDERGSYWSLLPLTTCALFTIKKL
ncbi:uncharacterized protein LOC135585217 isoform X1 [Musa acuminata AAA Group]|uniref:uncharacterized protein LOC135585217 isoform X1 n=1 Tax=Musa acuminata AAA Group TaxID=214697 RepID=UPI0031DA603F